MTTPSRRGVGLAALALALVATLAPVPGPAAAAATVSTRTSATYQLLPDSGLIRVTVVFTITNRVPPVSTACPPGYVNCTTSYYISQGSFAVDPDGTNFRVSMPGGSVRISVAPGGTGFLSEATVHFPDTGYGRTRAITTTYDIPGGAPRSASSTRAGEAYAAFCGFPPGEYPGDPESFRIVVPDRYTVTQTQGDPLTSSLSGGTFILASTERARPSGADASSACVEAADDNAYLSSMETSKSGIQLNTRAWPEDPVWMTSISSSVAEILDKLVEAIGQLPPTRSIEVREVAGEALGEYVGTFDSAKSVARVSEDALDPLVATHELAHAWFNDKFSPEPWLEEGYAEETARTVLGPSVIEPCPKPAASVLARVDISPWWWIPQPATDQDRQKVADDYATACWVVTEVADRAGAAGMRQIYAAAVAGEIAYVGATPAEVIRGGHVGWQIWLDLADERGLLPSGFDDLDWLQALLSQVGAADDPAGLARRSAARATYHALLDRLDGWSMPFLVRDAMASWNWDAADRTLAVVKQVADARSASVALVGALRETDTVRAAFEGAMTDSDLRAALDLANRERQAADAVGKAVATGAAERNPVEAIGLIGDNLAAEANGEVALLVAGKFDDATRAATATTEAGRGAALSGAVRLGGAGIVVISVGGATLLVRRRRATRGRRPVDTVSP
jgi:hypothetical protein